MCAGRLANAGQDLLDIGRGVTGRAQCLANGIQRAADIVGITFFLRTVFLGFRLYRWRLRRLRLLRRFQLVWLRLRLLRFFLRKLRRFRGRRSLVRRRRCVLRLRD